MIYIHQQNNYTMSTTNQLRKWMTLEADMNTSDIEERFEQIVKMLFENFAIQKGESKYLLKEIEFYFYNKNHRDIITHPRVSKALCWYVNDFGGIDLNFESIIQKEEQIDSKGKKTMKYVLDDESYFGGILIRQLISEDGRETLNGPLACAELFRCYEATGIGMNEDLPLLVERDNGKVEYFSKPRFNILRKNQTIEQKVNNILYEYHEPIDKQLLYSDFSNFINKHYGYERQTTSR
jgi:hypothetical protein